MIPAVVVPQGPAGAAYDKAATTILCDCGCHPQSVKDCACGRAEDMRVALAADAASGKSGDAIIASYVARYGQKILVAPPVAGFNLVAWAGPAVGLLAAAVTVTLVVRRWRRTSPAPEPLATGSPADVDQAYLRRLRKELEEGR